MSKAQNTGFTDTKSGSQKESGSEESHGDSGSGDRERVRRGQSLVSNRLMCRRKRRNDQMTGKNAGDDLERSPVQQETTRQVTDDEEEERVRRARDDSERESRRF